MVHIITIRPYKVEALTLDYGSWPENTVFTYDHLLNAAKRTAHFWHNLTLFEKLGSIILYLLINITVN
jgi:hypothetical protein